MEKVTKEHTILEDDHVVFLVELVEPQYSVLSVRNGWAGSVVV